MLIVLRNNFHCNFFFYTTDVSGLIEFTGKLVRKITFVFTKLHNVFGSMWIVHTAYELETDYQ